MDVLNKMIHVPERPGLNSFRFPNATLNGVQRKAYELFMSGIFHLRVLGRFPPQVTQTVENEAVVKGELYCISTNILFIYFLVFNFI